MIILFADDSRKLCALGMRNAILGNDFYVSSCDMITFCDVLHEAKHKKASSETQGQLVGARKSLNGREKSLGEEKSRTKSSLIWGMGISQNFGLLSFFCDCLFRNFFLAPLLSFSRPF